MRQGSYEDSAALEHSFEGADKVLLVSSNDPHADGVALHRVGIQAAVAAGAQRILYTSHQGSGADSPFPPARVHAATEQLLADSGTAWTSLRNGFYAHSLAWLLGPWQRTGTIVAPADGPVFWTHREDLAQTAVIILATTAVGRPIGRVTPDDENWIAHKVSTGIPEPMARLTLTTFHAARQHRFATTDPPSPGCSAAPTSCTRPSRS